MSEYDIAIKIAGKLEGSFKAALAGAKSGLTGLGVSGKVGSLALQGVSAAAHAAKVGLEAAGMGMVAVGTYAAKVGKDFEAQMSTVAAISGATGTEMDALSKKAKEMGATTSFSATEAGQAMEYMAMAGWKTEDMMNGIEGIMNLAAASGEDLAAVSDIVTDALTAFGKGADYAGTFADQLAAASANANVNVEMLGESFKYAAPVAGALGFTTADTAEALSLMGNAGIKASQAGTSMRRILNSLTADTLTFATSTGEVAIATQNADGTMRNLNDILDDSRVAFSQMTDAQKAQAAEALVGKNAMSGFLALMNAAPQDIDKVRSALENSAGAAAEMAAIRLDNLEGDITLLKSAAESFGISLYQNMQKPFRSVVQYAREQIGVLQEALESGGFEGLTEAIGTVLSDAIGKIADAAPAFIDGAANLLASFLDGINNDSAKIGTSIGKLMDSIGAAIIKLAPRLAVTGINILAAMAVGILDNMDIIGSAALEAVKYLWQSIKDAFKSFGNFLGDDEVQPFTKVVALLGGLAAGFFIFDGIGGAIKGFVSDFKTAGKSMPGATKGFVSSGNSMSKVAKNILAVGAGLALAAAGIWILTEAAIGIGEAGPGAVVALILMVGAIAGLMAIAGAFGDKLAEATPGLIAFGAAILLAAVGMAIMSQAAIALSEAGTGAMVMFGVMAAALLAFIVVASLLSGELITAGAGMLLLGAGILIAAAGMAIMAAAAIALSDAGAGAIIMLIGLVVIILLFGVACGVLAPLLIEGGVALLVFGAGLLVVAAAALVASVSLLIISTTLPAFAEYGPMAALGIMLVGASLLVLGAGALVAGIGLAVAGAGLLALGVAALIAMVPIVAIGAAFLAIGIAVAILATCGLTAVAALEQLTDFGLGTAASMTALAAALEIPIPALESLQSAFSTTMLAVVASVTAGLALAVSGMRAGIMQMIAVAAIVAVGVRAAFNIDLYSSGVDMMQGFINGMNSMRSRVGQAAREIATTASKTINDALQIHSPSRIMIGSGLNTGEGFALGMEKTLPDIQIAAKNMTTPVQAEAEQLNRFNAPTVNPRTGVIGEVIDLASSTTNNNTTQTSSPTFNFNPTYVIEGNADQEVIQQANKMSMAEFEKMMNDWSRKNGRTAFA